MNDSTFRATYTKDFYEPGGTAKNFAKPKADADKSRRSNAELAKEWGCTPRHASKIRRNDPNATCKPGCSCPVAMKALEAATAPEA